MIAGQRSAHTWLVVLCAIGACNTPQDHGNSRFETDGSTDANPGLIDDGGASEAPGSYRKVREIIERGCAYNRCHSGVPIGGALSLAPGGDHAAALINVPSCEYPALVRVKPGSAERSWLWIKLTAEARPRDDPFADYILFEPEPGWDESKRGCRDQTPDGTALFGQRMPLTAPNMLPEEDLMVIRDWISKGAPH